MKQNTLGFATLVSLALLISPFSFSVAKAESIVAPTTCYSFNKGFGRGASDARYQNAITQLQRFLSSVGYFDSNLVGSGYFGPRTHEAVVRFQKAYGISPTGFVGPLTRGEIQRHCGTPTNNPVTIHTVSPTQGAIATRVTITGSGFTDRNSIMMDGSVVARDVPITSTTGFTCLNSLTCKSAIRQTLVFTVPSALAPYCPVGYACAQYMRDVTPGVYTITVTNTSGTSNGMKFVVPGTTTTSPLSISALDAPTSLPIGVSGTWTVHTSTNTAVGNLHYSVVWGDEVGYQSASAFRAPDTQPLSTVATFSHSYRNTGTYVPVFTVSDDSGHSTSASASILITPIY